MSDDRIDKVGWFCLRIKLANKNLLSGMQKQPILSADEIVRFCHSTQKTFYSRR